MAARLFENRENSLNVESFSDTETAISRLNKEKFDCVITDYNLANIDGFELKDKVDVDIPFILLTGNGSEGLASKAVSKGFDDYIRKNEFTRKEGLLSNRIHNQVERKRAQRKSEQALKKFETIFENANDAIFLMDEKKFVECNRKASKMLKCTKENIVGSNPSRFVPENQPDGTDSNKYAIDKIGKAMDGEPQEFEWVQIDAEGDEFYAQVNLSGIMIEGEKLVQAIVRDVTERKREEKKLKRSEERYKTLVEGTQTGVIIFSKDELKYVNSKVREITGYEKEELSEMGDYEVFHPSDREKVARRARKRLNGEDVPSSYPIKIINKTGETRHCKIKAKRISLEGEKVIYASLIDITEQKRTEEKILGIQKATRMLFEKDKKEEISEASVKAAKEIFDFDIAGIHIKTEDEILKPVFTTQETSKVFDEGPQSYDRSNEKIWSVFEDNESLMINKVEELGFETPIESAIILPLRDFGVFIVSSERKNVFTDEDLRLGEVFSLAVNAALNSAEFEEQLKRERDRFAALFKNIPDPTAFLEDKGNEAPIKSVNPAFEEVFGLKERDIIGDNIDDHIVPDEKMDEAEKINQKVGDGDKLVHEVRRKTSDGERDFLIRNAMPSGQNHGYTIYTDITEQKEREREIERQKKRLEKFASVLSHDIKNPLNVAQGYLEIAREEREDDIFDEIEMAHQRIEDIIDSMLELARKGNTIDETEEISLKSITKEGWSMVGTGEAEIIIEDDIEFKANHSRVLRVFENILGNALEHGGEEVKIRVGKLDKPGFYIENDGDPINEDLKDQIFDYGFSGEGGTGFGLAIVKSIVEAHGWRLRLEKSDLGGPRFEIDFTSNI